MFKASWGLSSFTPGLNNTAGSCLPISSFLAPCALALIRLQISLSGCSTHKGGKCWTYITPSTSFKTEIPLSLQSFVMIPLLSFLTSPLCPAAFLWFSFLLPLFFFVIFLLLPPCLLFFSCVVWLPSWWWFIWTILLSLWESRHHHNGKGSHTYMHTDMVTTYTHGHIQGEGLEKAWYNTRKRWWKEFQMKQLDATCTDLCLDLYHNA